MRILIIDCKLPLGIAVAKLLLDTKPSQLIICDGGIETVEVSEALVPEPDIKLFDAFIVTNTKHLPLPDLGEVSNHKKSKPWPQPQQHIVPKKISPKQNHIQQRGVRRT
jgi:hypothetical protein